MTFIPPKITDETIAEWFRKMVEKNARTGSDYQNIVSMQEYREWLDELNREDAGE